MQAADTGVKAVSLDEEKIPTRVLRLINGFDAGKATLSNDEVELVVHNLKFTHDGGNNSTFKLSEESAGTLTWLSIAPILLQTLREGTILVVDELDSNLHQKLNSFSSHITQASLNIWMIYHLAPRQYGSWRKAKTGNHLCSRLQIFQSTLMPTMSTVIGRDNMVPSHIFQQLYCAG